MRKLRLVSSMLLGVFCLTATTHGQLVRSCDRFNQDATTLILGCNGELSVNGGGTELTTLEIISAGSLFRPENINVGVLPGLFDIIRWDKLFKLDPGGFDNVDFGQVLPFCTADVIIADFTVSGSYVAGGDLTSRGGGGPYLFALPEPSSAVLLGVGAIGMFGLRRRRRSQGVARFRSEGD